MRKKGDILGALVMAYSVVGAVAVALMMLHITADVIGKFLFNRPLPGTIPIVSQYYMVIVAFLPLAMVERMSGHISVEILVQRFPTSVQGALGAFARALGVVIFGLLTWRTWLEATKKQAIGTFSYEQGHKILTWPSYYVLPLGTGLLTLVLLWALVRHFRGGSDPSADPL